MNKRFQKARIDDEEIFILTTYPWRESSLWVEAFSKHHGRVALLARSARKRTSESRGVVMPFVPLTASWYGENELKTLHRVLWQGGWKMPQGKALFSAMYVNELVLKLTAREDANVDIFDSLQAVLRQIASEEHYLAALRLFEWKLLKSLGLAPTLEVDSQMLPIDGTRQYWLAVDSNPVLLNDGQFSQQWEQGVLISGEVLLSIAKGEFLNEAHLQEALRLNRFLLNHRLPEGIKSRLLLQQLQVYQHNR